MEYTAKNIGPLQVPFYSFAQTVPHIGSCLPSTCCLCAFICAVPSLGPGKPWSTSFVPVKSLLVWSGSGQISLRSLWMSSSSSLSSDKRSAFLILSKAFCSWCVCFVLLCLGTGCMPLPGIVSFKGQHLQIFSALPCLVWCFTRKLPRKWVLN